MQDKFPPITPMSEMKVLIIDNQPLVHEQIMSELRRVGLKHMHSAFNAFHALRMCSEQAYDIVFIAFNVSQDKDGFHLLEELKHNAYITRKTIVVFLSAETSAELVNCIVEMQPNDFWVKPLDQSKIKGRIAHIFNIRTKMHKLLHCYSIGEYSKAIYYAERQLSDPSMSDYRLWMQRMIGDCLLNLYEFGQAEAYFTELKCDIDYAWVYTGLAQSLLKQDKLDDAKTLMQTMLVRADTRFRAYDLMAQHYVEKEDYKAAYEQIKQASRLAPRNLQRNKRVWDLARLNHDRAGQLEAVQKIAQFAKNSIHDTPHHGMNVVRSTIDLATTLSNGESIKLFNRAEKELSELTHVNKFERDLLDPLAVLQVRLCCLKNDKDQAESLIKDIPVHMHAGASMEDCLDKMKAFHELGMREECIAILEQLKQRVAGNDFTNKVVGAYLEQEEIQRTEINFTAKELKEMASVNYRDGRYLPAVANLQQALTLAPHDKQIALSLLKVLSHDDMRNELTPEQTKLATDVIDNFAEGQLSPSQHQSLSQYVKALM